MKYLLFSLFTLTLSLVFQACGGNEELRPDTKPDTNVESNSKADDSDITTDFNTVTAFSKDTMSGLLKELGLGMCNPSEKNEDYHTLPPCSPKFFRLFPFSKNKGVEDAFLLLVKARVHDFPLRRLFVFVREEGKLVKVNGFVANLIGKVPSKSGYDDLLLRFSDKDQNHFNCRYVWRNMHYEFDRVEQINDANLKAEFQDSMNKVIEQEIIINRMHF